jgi:hypothetical protein
MALKSWQRPSAVANCRRTLGAADALKRAADYDVKRLFPPAAIARIILLMSPTVFREGGFRFYFFSREESRIHVHVQGQNGEAKFWLEPSIELAQYVGLTQREINEALRLVQEHQNDIRSAWHKHFPG